MAARIKTFRELDVWNLSMSLAVLCYRLTEAFPSDERFGLTSQVRRGASSIPANVAEGHNRRSRRAYLNHVNIALGSQAELDTLLELAVRLNYLRAEHLEHVQESLDRTGQMLHALSRSLENTEDETRTRR